MSSSPSSFAHCSRYATGRVFLRWRKSVLSASAEIDTPSRSLSSWAVTPVLRPNRPTRSSTAGQAGHGAQRSGLAYRRVQGHALVHDWDPLEQHVHVLAIARAEAPGGDHFGDAFGARWTDRFGQPEGAALRQPAEHQAGILRT